MEPDAAARTISLVVRLLPREHRDRYRSEFAGELHELSRLHQLAYVLRVLVHLHALSHALAAASAIRVVGSVPAGAAPLKGARSRLYCRSRLHHRWRILSVEDGTSRYRQCEACGRESDLPVRSNVLPLQVPVTCR